MCHKICSTLSVEFDVKKVVEEEVPFKKKLSLPVASERYPAEGTVSISSIMFEPPEQSEKLWQSVKPSFPHSVTWGRRKWSGFMFVDISSFLSLGA